MHIWQYFRKNFNQMPTVFCSITVFDEKVYVFQKTFSPYFSYRHVGRSFDNPAEKNCEKHLKSSIKIPTLWKKLTIFRKTSLWNFLLNTYNAVLLTPLENLLHKTEKYFLHFRRCWFFLKISLSPNISSGHLESRFLNPAGKISTEEVPLNKTIWWKEL